MTEERPRGPIRVVVADDHDLVRAGFATILDAQEDIEVVAEAGDGRAALAAARRWNPDVICMDVQMPVMDGLEATERIAAEPHLHAAILILTTFEREDYLLRALRAGASGFLLKNSRPEQLVAAVRALAAGDALLAPELTRTLIARFAAGAGAPPTGAEGLTARETEVLRLLARGMTNDEIAAELVLGRATVKTHVSSLLAKLGARDRVQAVVWAHTHGVT